jgi:hypothetical protein
VDPDLGGTGESLKDLGYVHAGIDEGWEGCGKGVNGTEHDEKGIPVINTDRFPDTKGVVEYGHSKGLLIGWYQNGCACGEREEHTINYEGDIASLHALGFDAVKFDGCGAQNNMTLYAQLMNQTGKSFEIEDCKAGDCAPGSDNSGCATASWCPFNKWRVSRDIDNSDTRWFLNMQSATRFLDPEQGQISQPHCWAYLDMLEVGRLSTYALNRAHFGAWCIVSSPLYLGLDLRQVAAVRRVWDILSNKEALAVNQEYVGDAGHLVMQWTPKKKSEKGGTAAAEGSSTGAEGSSTGAEMLWAQMLYPDCDASDPRQGKWTYDASAKAVKYQERCLDRSSSINHLRLQECDGSTGQQFDCTVKNATAGKTCKIKAVGSSSDSSNSDVPYELCVNANDWNWNNLYMDECGEQHYHTTQDFTFHSNGLLSSVQVSSVHCALGHL